MNGQQNPLVLITFCAVLVAFSIWGLVAAIRARLLSNIDGLLMVAVCLMIAVIFGLLLYVLAKEQGWLGKHSKNGGPSHA